MRATSFLVQYGGAALAVVANVAGGVLANRSRSAPDGYGWLYRSPWVVRPSRRSIIAQHLGDLQDPERLPPGVRSELPLAAEAIMRQRRRGRIQIVQLALVLIGSWIAIGWGPAGTRVAGSPAILVAWIAVGSGLFILVGLTQVAVERRARSAATFLRNSA